MKWKHRRRSDMVEDRRGRSPLLPGRVHGKKAIRVSKPERYRPPAEKKAAPKKQTGGKIKVTKKMVRVKK